MACVIMTGTPAMLGRNASERLRLLAKFHTQTHRVRSPMRIPKELQQDAARDFWKRNAPLMAQDGRLTDATRDAFVLLCQMWAKLVEGEASGLDAIKIVALSKQCQNMMAAYGMTPASRKRLKLDEKKTDLHALLTEALGGDDAD